MSRFRKLRNDPVQYFRDSRSAIGRGIGAVLARARYGRDQATGWDDAARRRHLIDAAGRPTVSVVMAALNAEATIAAAVTSVLQQTYDNIELIAVDDGSSDRSGEILANLASHDVRLRVLRNDAPTGVAAARNRGLSEATGDYLAFQDSDDTADPERIERQLAALLATSTARVSLCNGRRVDAAGAVVAINGRTDVKWVPSMMFSREVFERVGYFMPLRISEDAEYYERIKAVFGDDAEVRLYTTLYFARFSRNSLLFSDGDTSVEGGGVSHTRSADAERALVEFRARHDRIRRGELDPYVAREEAHGA